MKGDELLNLRGGAESTRRRAIELRLESRNLVETFSRATMDKSPQQRIPLIHLHRTPTPVSYKQKRSAREGPQTAECTFCRTTIAIDSSVLKALEAYKSTVKST
jgi:hypothetical protein